MPDIAPTTAVIIPVLNEAAYIDACLASLVGGTPDAATCFVVMDGGSTDGTQAIVASWAAQDGRVSLQPNPGRLQSAAMNLAARQVPASVTVLVRADAHALYPAGFVATVVGALAAHAATSVVVPMRTVGQGGFQQAVAAAQNSLLGNGGSAHRKAGQSRFVDHGHHAAFDRAFFTQLGGYNESFSHNEDAEYDARGAAGGGRAWMCTEAAVTYFPRATVAGLARQYSRHGRGRGRTMLLHRMRPRLRQMLPVVILAGVVGGAVLSLVHPIFLLAPLGYAALCLGWGAVAAIRQRDTALLGMGVAVMAMHLAWGWGFLQAMARR